MDQPKPLTPTELAVLVGQGYLKHKSFPGREMLVLTYRSHRISEGWDDSIVVQLDVFDYPIRSGGDKRHVGYYSFFYDPCNGIAQENNVQAFARPFSHDTQHYFSIHEFPEKYRCPGQLAYLTNRRIGSLRYAGFVEGSSTVLQETDNLENAHITIHASPRDVLFAESSHRGLEHLLVITVLALLKTHFPALGYIVRPNERYSPTFWEQYDAVSYLELIPGVHFWMAIPLRGSIDELRTAHRTMLDSGLDF